MTKAKPEKKPEEKLQDGKKAARAAEKKKTQQNMKKAADKLLTEMAANKTGAGEATTFLKLHHAYDKIEAEIKKLHLAKRGIRGQMKEMKIEMLPYDQVRKLYKMDPEDRRAFKATTTLYENQLGMDLSPEQQEQLAEINKKRESAKALASDVMGAAGKEVGSGESTADDVEDEESAVPARNEEVRGGIRGALATH